jgi:uncharacterized membrane protein YdjX (TVP38/TMEM64 family)
VFTILSLILGNIVGKEQLEIRVQEAWSWGPVILIFWKACSVIFAPFAWSVVYVIAGWLYGTSLAILYSLYGNIIGITCAFYIWRIRWSKAVSRLVGEESMQEVTHLVGHLQNIKTYTLSRIFLAPLEDLLNYAAWMSSIHYLPFIIISSIVTTAISLLPILLGSSLI